MHCIGAAQPPLRLRLLAAARMDVIFGAEEQPLSQPDAVEAAGVPSKDATAGGGAVREEEEGAAPDAKSMTEVDAAQPEASAAATPAKTRGAAATARLAG